MNPKILCCWLGLPEKNWPPDHYALLGLPADEADAARIEHQVQERMARLRCFQLSHPDEATEGMNRIAQAFICLMEKSAKPASPATPSATGNGAHGGAGPAGASLSPAAGSPSAAPPAALQETKAIDQTLSDWKNAPPPVRGAKDKSNPNWAPGAVQTPSLPAPAASAPAAPAASAPVTTAPVATAPVSPTPALPPPATLVIDPIFELAHRSTEARRGIGHLRALIDRISATRHLLRAWHKAGKYLGNPKRKITRPAEETELTRRLHKIFELTADYPKFVGHPGKPGYRVVAMARLEMTTLMFKALDATQREALARDWEAGHEVLLSHRSFLRYRFKALRRRRWPSLVVQAVRSALNDHPAWVVLGVAVLAALIALCWWKVF